MQKPVMLLILDGWGYRANVTPDNAIEQGHTPNCNTPALIKISQPTRTPSNS